MFTPRRCYDSYFSAVIPCQIHWVAFAVALLLGSSTWPPAVSMAAAAASLTTAKTATKKKSGAARSGIHSQCEEVIALVSHSLP